MKLLNLISTFQPHRTATVIEEKAEKTKATPIVQWVGGKRQLIDSYSSFLPEEFETYYEPFAGGAALLFHFHNKFGNQRNYFISDLNRELIITYEQVQNNATQINKILSDMYERHTKEFYYAVRNIDRTQTSPKRYKKDFDIFDKLTDLEIAARFLYLNRTCFNAIYRVNKEGMFNVPIGTSLKKDFRFEATLSKAAQVFRDTEVKLQCYSKVEELITDKDFVFFDPPYAPLSATSSFTSYTKDGFDVKEQKELRDLCVRLDKRGVRFALSNSNCDLIRDLYKDFKIETFEVNRNLNSKKEKRKNSAEEVLVINY